MTKVKNRKTVQAIAEAGGYSIHVHNHNTTECKSCGAAIPRQCGWKWRLNQRDRFCLCADCDSAVTELQKMMATQ